MMSRPSCRELERCLDTYVDGELDPSEMLSVEEHIEQCEECARRVQFHRALRMSLKTCVHAVRSPDRLRARMACVLAQVREEQIASVPPDQPVAQKQADVVAVPPRMLSWKVVGPLAAAAALALVLGSLSRSADQALHTNAPTTGLGVGSANIMSLDTLLEDLVDQHAHPLPPETTNPGEVARFDQFIGVPVRPPAFNRFQGTLLGARMVPIRQNRAAMLQYLLKDGHRVSVYVYNPTQLRVVASPKLRERVVENNPVYVGFVRGYSVAVTDRRGVGYALATDLDEQESSKMIVAVDLPQ